MEVSGPILICKCGEETPPGNPPPPLIVVNPLPKITEAKNLAKLKFREEKKNENLGKEEKVENGKRGLRENVKMKKYKMKDTEGEEKKTRGKEEKGRKKITHLPYFFFCLFQWHSYLTADFIKVKPSILKKILFTIQLRFERPKKSQS